MPNKIKLHIIVGQVRVSASFRMTNNSIAEHRWSGALTYVGSVSEDEMSKCVCALAAMSLQNFSCIVQFRTSLGYSIGLDIANIHGSCFLDLRIRFFASGKIQKLHLLEISFNTFHTHANVCDVVVRVLQVVVREYWNEKLIGICD